MKAADYIVQPVNWHDARAALAAVRRRVFIEEQGVPEELEWDEYDAAAVHVLACAADTPIGTGRLIESGRIGRLAVLAHWRGRGVGDALLDLLIGIARERRYAVVKLHAQTHAISFYARHGFNAVGADFLEAGIPHREMVLQLPPASASRA